MTLQIAVDKLIAADFRSLPLPVLGDEILELSRQLERLEAAYLARLDLFENSRRVKVRRPTRW